MSIYLIVQGNCPDKKSYKVNPANYSFICCKVFPVSNKF